MVQRNQHQQRIRFSLVQQLLLVVLLVTLSQRWNNNNNNNNNGNYCCFTVAFSVRQPSPLLARSNSVGQERIRYTTADYSYNNKFVRRTMSLTKTAAAAATTTTTTLMMNTEKNIKIDDDDNRSDRSISKLLTNKELHLTPSSQSPMDWITKLVTTTVLALVVQFQPINPIPTLQGRYQSNDFVSLLSSRHVVAYADNYNALSDEQKVVAEAWRLIDNSYFDRTFNGIDWFQVRQNYVTKKKYKTMDDVETAITEITAQLGDPYTRYLNPAKYQSIVNSATGTLAGTGIEISIQKDTGKLYASDVQENSPAYRAGIRPGDVFVEVDGTRFDNDPSATPDDVALKLRGPQNSRVGVVMQRNNEKIDVILVREPITITAVKSYLSSVPGVGKVGVLRIKNFSGTTAATVKEQYNELKKQGATTYIIDLRKNPGGLLPGGVDTASLFLDTNKPLVYVVNKAGIVDSQSTLGPGIDIESPIVVLVDRNTASAAEVFTAALQENNRAIVVGETTFGKGIVQTIRELRAGTYGGIAITVARYETPLHNNINQRGIPVTIPTNVDCPIDDAIVCLTKSSTSASSSTPISSFFQKPKE